MELRVDKKTGCGYKGEGESEIKSRLRRRTNEGQSWHEQIITLPVARSHRSRSFPPLSTVSMEALYTKRVVSSSAVSKGFEKGRGTTRPRRLTFPRGQVRGRTGRGVRSQARNDVSDQTSFLLPNLRVPKEQESSSSSTNNGGERRAKGRRPRAHRKRSSSSRALPRRPE